ncbi:HpcH/HpaI aldolase/citrate lyase family protein [Apiospora hydei]|uniref:HpcH/HpaI aldolase/citrate lyase family protein n=1 Tax=Apiospora hydei TaxID=1337664 RepID=A0ABR1X3T8_9PEZI
MALPSQDTTSVHGYALRAPQSLFRRLLSTSLRLPSLVPKRVPFRQFQTRALSNNMLQGCKAREALANSDGASLGLWQTFPGANISRTLARSDGIDWVMVDCEHGNIDDAAMHEAVPAIASCGVSPLVRLPDMQGWMIKRALDAGAHGILIPLLRSAEEARKVVAAAKFPPVGQRGLGSPFAMERFTPVPTMTEYLQTANDSLLTMVQIETKEALEAVEEIAAVPGVDLLFVGPFDLGNNIGLPILDGVMEPGLEEAIDRILAVAHVAGKKAAFFATSGPQAKKYADKGFDMISVALDATALQQTMSVSLNSARGLDAPSAEGRY